MTTFNVAIAWFVVKRNVVPELNKHHSMRHKGSEGTVQDILSLALDGDDWSALHLFTLKENVPNVQLGKRLDETQSLPSMVPERKYCFLYCSPLKPSQVNTWFQRNTF
jgi:hypothetical protein